eukprot:2626543-Rhodomonas_salina.1
MEGRRDRGSTAKGGRTREGPWADDDREHGRTTGAQGGGRMVPDAHGRGGAEVDEEEAAAGDDDVVGFDVAVGDAGVLELHARVQQLVRHL